MTNILLFDKIIYYFDKIFRHIYQILIPLNLCHRNNHAVTLLKYFKTNINLATRFGYLLTVITLKWNNMLRIGLYAIY